MKGFKLIKTYSNSPPLGFVVEEQTYPFNNIFIGVDNDRVIFKFKELVNYPQFWEKIN